MQTLAEKPQGEGQPKLLLTPEEFRQAMQGRIGRNSVYALLEAKRIKSIRIGRKILIPASEVEDFPRREAEAS